MRFLIELYEAWNKPEEAEMWRVELSQTEAAEERDVTQKQDEPNFFTHKAVAFLDTLCHLLISTNLDFARGKSGKISTIRKKLKFTWSQ